MHRVDKKQSLSLSLGTHGDRWALNGC